MRRTARLWAIASVVVGAAVLGGALVTDLDLAQQQEFSIGTPFHAGVPAAERTALLVVVAIALLAAVAAEVSRRRSPLDPGDPQHPVTRRPMTSDDR